MKDLEIKKYVLSHKLDKLYRQVTYANFKKASTGEIVNEEATKIFNDLILSEDEERVINNLNVSRKYRIKKLKTFITNQIFSKAQNNPDFTPIFATFTFNDKLLSLSHDARKKRIKYLIKKYSYSCALNIDFGKTTEREHYHAIMLIHKDNISLLENAYKKNGFITLKPVKLNSNENLHCERIAKYMNKLVYHAIKDTTSKDNTSYRIYYYKTLDKNMQVMI